MADMIMKKKQKIYFYDDLYLGENIEDVKKIKKKMKTKKFIHSIFAITLPIFNSEGLLEIYNASEFLQKIYDDRKIIVVGLADNKNEAMEISCKIVSDCYFETGDFKIRKYLCERQGSLL